ncbi:Zinc ion binding [Pleurostoma richardsiae]|uniref:Zinc ion binding n=1 Tax=Pleurostoma richardsiae TaxID=41990 RepID=A0AA38VK59_9PEZI|nr:Zinc ion binding [Pleurostoma richardsiae]
MPKSKSAVCSHPSLHVDVSSHAEDAGFRRPDRKRRAAATTRSGRYTSGSPAEKTIDGATPEGEFSFTFPAPLVLPGDGLALDPRYPPQSLRSWLLAPARNKATSRKQTIYVTAPPRVEEDVSVMGSWTGPVIADSRHTRLSKLCPPKAEDVTEYLRAFYHGFTVREGPKALSFVPWETSFGSSEPEHVGLADGSICTRVRTRACPDGAFRRQLNLNDMLDAAIDLLPDDAYALLVLVDHDLYCDDDDDFCCGLAYGGSRVAIVSSARYHPALFKAQGVDQAHMWPASHCEAYVEALAGRRSEETLRPPTMDKSQTPLGAALEAAKAAGMARSSSGLQSVWLACLARTASHELGHCLGLDHCVYYACVMQGTAVIAEDHRQPPYLCPVCLSKLIAAVGDISREMEVRTYRLERYMAMIQVCERWKEVGVFAGHAAWMAKLVSRSQE